MNILLPAVHPRMGSALSAADSSPLLEPPGFLLRNYGRGTPIATLLAHIAYGAIVGGFASIGRLVRLHRQTADPGATDSAPTASKGWVGKRDRIVPVVLVLPVDPGRLDAGPPRPIDGRPVH